MSEPIQESPKRRRPAEARQPGNLYTYAAGRDVMRDVMEVR